MNKSRFFRAAGYLFTWHLSDDGARARVDMHRESRVGGARYWVTFAECTPSRSAVYASALGLVAWIADLDITPRADMKAMAVAESLAILCDRMRQTEASGDLQQRVVLAQIVGGRVAAA